MAFNFFKPAKFADLLEVKTSLVSMKSASLEMFQEIFRGDELLFSAKVKLAYLKDFKPSKIPQNLMEFF